MKIAIFGCGGLGKVIAESLQRLDKFELAGFLDDNPKAPADVLGVKTIGCSEDILPLTQSGKLDGIIIAIGSNKVRKIVAEKISSLCETIKFPTVIDPAATVSLSAKIDCGCYIAAGVVLGPSVMMGKFSIANTAAVIEHDSELGSFSYVGPRALVDSRAKLAESASLAGGQIVGQDKIFDGSDIYSK